MLACAMTGMNFNIASPKGFAIDASVLKKAQTYAKTSGSKIFVTEDPQAAARDADVIYTDTWTSMGQEAEAAARRKAFAGYQVNEKLLALTRNNSIIMHCLPAHHGERGGSGPAGQSALGGFRPGGKTGCTPRKRCWHGYFAKK